jgi:hypothetical protein
MRQSNIIELRAIHRHIENDRQVVRVSVRRKNERRLDTFELPEGLPITHNNLVIYIQDRYPDFIIEDIRPWLMQKNITK